MFCRYLWSSIEHSTSCRVSLGLPIIEKDLEFFWVKMLAASSQDRMNRVRSVLLTNVSFWEATIKNVSFWEATIKVQPVSSFLSTWICSIYSSPHNTNISPHNTNGPILLEITSPRVVTNWDRQCWARQKNDKSWKSNKSAKNHVDQNRAKSICAESWTVTVHQWALRDTFFTPSRVFINFKGPHLLFLNPDSNAPLRIPNWDAIFFVIHQALF